MGIRTPVIILTSLLTAGLAFAAPGQGASTAVKDAIEATEAGPERGKAVSEAARAHRGLGKDKARTKAPGERNESAEHVDGERGKSAEHTGTEATRGKATSKSKQATRAERRAERKAKRAERKGDGPRHPELPEPAEVPDAK